MLQLQGVASALPVSQQAVLFCHAVAAALYTLLSTVLHSDIHIPVASLLFDLQPYLIKT